MADDFQDFRPGLEAPASNAAVVIPDDSADLPSTTRSLYIGGDGDVEVDMVGAGQAIIFYGCVAGDILPVRATRVRSANTTATNIIALW